MYIFIYCIYIYIYIYIIFFYIIYNTWFDLSQWHDLAGCFRQRRLMSSHRSQSSTDSRVHFSWYDVCLSHGMVFTGIFELQILVNLAWKVATCSHLATPQLGQSPRKLCLVCLNLGIQSPKDVVQRRRGRFFWCWTQDRRPRPSSVQPSQRNDPIDPAPLDAPASLSPLVEDAAVDDPYLMIDEVTQVPSEAGVAWCESINFWLVILGQSCFTNQCLGGWRDEEIDQKGGQIEWNDVKCVVSQRSSLQAIHVEFGDDWAQRLKIVLCRPESKGAIVTDKSGCQFLGTCSGGR